MTIDKEKVALNKVINNTGAYILSEIEEIKKSSRMKTDLRKKRALIELWNWTIERVEEGRAPDATFDKAVLHTYYGMVNALSFDKISLNDCYRIMQKIATDMINVKKGDW